jgi:hypothetical protein
VACRSLDRICNFDEVWQLRCDAFVKISDDIVRVLDRAAPDGKVVAIPAETQQ